jgi:hypothetical protein
VQDNAFIPEPNEKPGEIVETIEGVDIIDVTVALKAADEQMTRDLQSQVPVEEGRLEPVINAWRSTSKGNQLQDLKWLRRENSKVRIGGTPIWILQILSRMSSAGAAHPFRWGAELNCVVNAMKHSAVQGGHSEPDLDLDLFLKK